MYLTSSGFAKGQSVPRKFTCEGENISPDFHWENAPQDTKAFALILHDPDASRPGGFTHWVLYDIPASVKRIPENIPKSQERVPDLGVQGRNDSGKLGYTGPCPPSGTHRYFAKLYALRRELGLKPGASQQELESAMDGCVIEEAEIMSTYAKASAKTA
jgi:Raf kinase inhibitor-like YbhB/YbcL family protein